MGANDVGPDGAAAPSLPEAPGLTEGRFAGREAFRQRVREALASAAREGWNELILSDANFHDWPLGERAVVAALNDWACAGRSLVMLGKTYDEVIRHHPRFVTWRRTWDHIVTCRRCAAADPLLLPSAVWTSGWMMHRLDPQHSRGVCSQEPERRLALHESLQEWLRQSAPGFPASTLGL